MENDNVEAVAFNTVEFTMIDPLSESEKMKLIQLTELADVEAAVSKSGRLVIFSVDHVEEATSFLAALDLIDDIGLIKHITEYQIINDSKMIHVTLQ